MDLSGATPAVQFAKLVKDTLTHSPKTKEEALALYKYLMKSQVEAAVEAIMDICIENLPETDKALIKAAVKEAEVVLAKCGCWP